MYETCSDTTNCTTDCLFTGHPCDDNPNGTKRVEVAGFGMYTRGNRDLLQHLWRAVCVTGSRAATAYGEHVATELATGLQGNVIVTSGAYGIDAAAIRGALAAGVPVIVAVAGGLDRPYPAGHGNLFGRVIAAGGLLVSLQPDGATPTKARFEAMRDLIAEMSRAVVVVEAGARSGGSDIARRANLLGKPVMAVPGPVTSAASSGTNQMIRDGIATLVTCAADVTAKINEAIR